MDSYPKRRSITRVKELTEEGINVPFGQDDVFDPWYPLGNGSLRDVNLVGMLACQMMGYQDLKEAYRFITDNAAKTLHIQDRYGIEEGKPANFIILDAKDYYEAMNQNAVVLASYRGGKKIMEGVPAKRTLLLE